MGERPVKAVGFGGRARRIAGDTYDYLSADFSYESNKQMLATGRQINGCNNDFSVQIIGTKGLVFYNFDKNITITDVNGNSLWEYDYKTNPVKNPYEQEHIHFVESIRLDKKINQAEDLAHSTLISIMGRLAAYTGKTVTWDEAMASDVKFGPENYALGAVPEYHEGVVPVPGNDPGEPRT
jgi:predicted dehydrogenase